MARSLLVHGLEAISDTWTEQVDAIAPRAQVLTTRAGRWATLQVGRNGRAVSEVARELGCDWHREPLAAQANFTLFLLLSLVNRFVKRKSVRSILDQESSKRVGGLSR